MDSPPPESTTAAPPEPANTRPASRRRRVWATLAGVALLIVTGVSGVMVLLPGYVEKRVRNALNDLDLEHCEFRIDRVTFNRLEASGLFLADPGWEVRAERIEATYDFPGLLRRRVGVITVEGLDAEIELPEKPEAAPPPGASLAAETAGEPSRWLSQAGGIFSSGEVFLPDAFLRVRKGRAEEQFTLNGFFHLNGPLEFFADGTGPAELSLMAEGTVESAQGRAAIDWNGEFNQATALFDAFVPEWKPANASLDLGDGTIQGRLIVDDNRLSLADIHAQVEMQGADLEAWRAGPATLTVTSRDGAVFDLTSTSLEFGADPAVSGHATLRARVGPGPVPPGLSVEGEVNLESATIQGMTVEPVAVGFSGPPQSLVVALGRITSRDRPGWAIDAVQANLKGLGTNRILASGNARVEAVLPGWSPAGAVGPDQPFICPLTFAGELGSDRQTYRLQLGPNGPDDPPLALESDTGGWKLRLAAPVEAEGVVSPKGDHEADWQLHAGIPAVEWSRGAGPLVSVTDFALEGGWSGGSGQLTGGGQFNGAPFPVQLTHVAGSTDPVVPPKTEVSVGPVRLDRAVWPGELIEGWRGAKLSGEFLLNGSLLLPSEAGTGVPTDLTVRLRGGELVYPDGRTTAHGVHGEARIIALDPPAYAPGISLAIDRIASGGHDSLTTVRTSLTLAKDGSLRVDSFRGNLFGGVVELERSTTIPADGGPFTMVFALHRLLAREIVHLFPAFKGEIEASVSGRVPLEVRDGHLRLLQGTLALDSSPPAHLRYEATGLLTEGQNPKSRGYKVNQSVERALGNLSVASLDVRLFDPADPAHPAIIKIAGTGSDEQISVPVTLNVPVEDQEGILRSLFAKILSGGMNVVLE